jgi:hypothetical protein
MDFDALMSQYQQSSTSENKNEASPATSNSFSVTHQSSSQKKRAFRPRRREPGRVLELNLREYKLERLYGEYQLWDDEWVGEPDNVVVIFEAKADNDVTVGISLDKGVTTGFTYEIVIGGWKNTKSAIRTEAQGQERAVSFEARMCNGENFLTYWVGLRNGIIAAGAGDKPGKNILIAWKNPQHDPEDAQPCWVSFTDWDNVMILKNVRIFNSSSFDYDWIAELGEPQEWVTKYVPSYIHAFEEERAANVARAQRFGVEFVAPDAHQILNKMPHAQRELVKASQLGRLGGGFVTGFDTGSAEEQQNRQARAARFGISDETPILPSSSTPALLPTDEQLAEKRVRAARFGVPLNEQARLVTMCLRLPVRRRDPSSDEVFRPETLHIYGDLTSTKTRHILDAFQDFNPSHIEWLNDFSCNVVFADVFTCERAKAALCRQIPPPLDRTIDAEITQSRVEFEAELQKMIDQGWKFFAIKDGKGGVQYILARGATSADVKAEVYDEHYVPTISHLAESAVFSSDDTPNKKRALNDEDTQAQANDESDEAAPREDVERGKRMRPSDTGDDE